MQPGQGQPRGVIVHGAEDVARTLLIARERPPWLVSARGAAGYLGVAGFAALLDAHQARHLGILDAADAPGHALAALRHGFGQVILSPAVPGFAALAELAAGMGAVLLAEGPPVLDLARVDLRKPQGRKHLARWLDLA